MRIRTIKPDIWRSEDFCSLSDFGQLMFIGLINYVDDNGVGLCNPVDIAADLFAGRLASDPAGTLRKITEVFGSLSERGMATFYEAKIDGKTKKLVFLTNWDRHQRISHPKKPRYPRPSNDSGTSEAPSTENFGKLRKSSEDCGKLPLGTGNREEGNREQYFSFSSREREAKKNEEADTIRTEDTETAPTPDSRRRPEPAPIDAGWEPGPATVAAIADETGGRVDVGSALDAFTAYHQREGDERTPAQWEGLFRGWCSNAAGKGRYPPKRVELPGDGWIERHLTLRLPDGADANAARRRLFDLVRSGLSPDGAAEAVLAGIASPSDASDAGRGGRRRPQNARKGPSERRTGGTRKSRRTDR